MVEKYVEHGGKLYAVMSLSNKIHITVKFVPAFAGLLWRIWNESNKFECSLVSLAGLFCYLEKFKDDNYVIQFDKHVETYEKVHKMRSPDDEINLTVEFVNKTAGLAYRLGSASHEFACPLVLFSHLFCYLNDLEAGDYIIQFDEERIV